LGDGGKLGRKPKPLGDGGAAMKFGEGGAIGKLFEEQGARNGGDRGNGATVVHEAVGVIGTRIGINGVFVCGTATGSTKFDPKGT